MGPAFCYCAQKNNKKAVDKYKKSTNDKEVKNKQGFSRSEIRRGKQKITK